MVMLTRMVCAVVLVLYAVPVQAVTIVTGSYTGDASDNRNITISPACQPKAVFLKNNSASGNGHFRTASMSTSGFFTSTTQGNTDSIQAMNSDGFQIGATFVNVNTNVFRYLAICDNGANDLAEGTYAGNGADNRDITISPAFQPELVIVLTGQTGGVHAWRGATSHSGDLASKPNVAQADAADLIQSFGASGFQVGVTINTSGQNYYYLAFKGSANGVATGSYTGNATDNRNITVTTFTPEFVGAKASSTSNVLAFRFGSNSGDESFCGSTAGTADIIQSLSSGQFQVGTHACANQNATTVRWFALADVDPSGHPAMRRWGGIPGMGPNLTGRGGF